MSEELNRLGVIANISHEIRTPMNAILGYSELILQVNENNDTAEYAKEIQSAAGSLLAMVNDLLDISKIEFGKMELVPVEYYLHYLFSDVEALVGLSAKNKGLEFKVDVNPEIPGKLYGDIVRIRQTLTNIVNNAVKYTRKGHVVLSADYEDLGDDKIHLIFKVSDTGIGIKEENLKTIFDSFTQVDTRANRGIEGTGLGLSITKKLVDMMDGKIDVESVYGEGTTFTITIPQSVAEYVKISTKIVTSKSDQKKKKSQFFAPSAKILCVDDNIVNLRIISKMLRHYQVEADICESGKEALELLEKGSYDLVFLDHMMPEMDGVEVCHAIRENKKEKIKNVPVIAVSANAVRGIRDMFVKEGFNDYLSKPVETEKIEHILLSYISDNLIVREEVVSSEKSDIDVELEIDGIDIFSGLIKCDNIMADYIDILNIVALSGEEKALDIKKFAEEKNYENYRIAVHAAKSVAASIGAHKLFTFSKIHELAAKNLQTELIDKNYDAVVNEYLKVVNNIKTELEGKGLLAI